MTGCGSGEGRRLGPRPLYCGGCGEQPVSKACHGSLRRRGLRKAHWECWSECNLSCPFCFRTDGRALDTESGIRILRALSTGDIRAVVFAGGDPSLWRDLPDLVGEALALGLAVQVQTNAQHVSKGFLDALGRCEYVGLSLDGPDPATHDAFRRKPGNFRRVMSLLGTLDRLGIPVSVRTVVAGPNHRRVPEMAQLVASYSNLICWKLLEFSPVGNGFSSRDRHALAPDIFERTVLAVRERFDGLAAPLEVLRNADKVGIYMMISPHGMVYGTTRAALMETGHHQYVGSVLSEHLQHLADKIPFFGRRPDRTVPDLLAVRSGSLPSAG